ncbi:MAG: pentapeptide repeat-containing protein [Bryobacteraceae bacterium]|jgi:G:T/U-mismatch repair DNA glycosylase
MDEESSASIDRARQLLLALALKTEDSAAISAAIEASKFVEEGKKLRAEAAKLDEEVKVVKKQSSTDRIVKVAQAITPVGLLLTVMLQAFQIWSTQRSQAEVEETASWRDGLKAYMAANPRSSAASAAFFQSHLNSKSNGAVARQLLLQELPHVSVSRFKDLFSALFPDQSPSEVDEIVAVDRELLVLTSTPGAPERAGLSTYDVTYNISHLTDQLGGRLRARSGVTEALDLRWTQFTDGDWRLTNLRRARLDGTGLYNMNLKGANLCEATADDIFRVDYTAWWEADAIAPALLKLLVAKTNDSERRLLPTIPSPNPGQAKTSATPGTATGTTPSPSPVRWQFSDQQLEAFHSASPKACQQ